MTALSASVVAVTGLRAEARIAAGSGTATLSGGGDAARLALMLQSSLLAGAGAVISFGIAGGLHPDLPPGAIVVAEAVADGDTCWPVDHRWMTCLLERLPAARRGRISGVDGAVAGVQAKAALHARDGALVVDMESHIAARLAAQHGVPFAAVRVVADPAERTLPRAALVGMRRDGSTDVAAVLRALAAKPGELPGLIRTALDAKAAFAALKRSRRSLGETFGFAGASQPTFPEIAVEAAGALALVEAAGT